jgi:hypothetical protein
VHVEIYATLYLEQGQVGDHEQFGSTVEAAKHMFEAVRDERLGDERLRMAWYTGRDQGAPRPERLAHLSLMREYCVRGVMTRRDAYRSRR